MSRDIYLVTHAQSAHHVQGLVGGWYDSELTPTGRRHANAIAERIAELVGSAPVELYASDLKRAAQTAAIIGDRLGKSARLMPGLREKSFGVAGGMPVAWLEERCRPAGVDDDRLDHDEGVEGAETRRQLLCRIYAAMDEILASPVRTQVIVTHGFALTFVIAAWFRVPPDAAGWIAFRPHPGGVSHLREDDRFGDRALVTLDDHSHLHGL